MELEVVVLDPWRKLASTDGYRRLTLEYPFSWYLS